MWYTVCVHELSITSAILDNVIRHAEQNGAESVTRVLLVVSELCDLHPVWLQRYFTDLAAGTIAADARLEIERRAPQFTCNSCANVFDISLAGIDQVRCPKCRGADCRLMSGADYILEEIEIEP